MFGIFKKKKERTRARVPKEHPLAWEDSVTIHCKDDAECEEVQKKLLKKGFKWNSGARHPKKTPSNIITAHFYSWVSEKEEKVITHTDLNDELTQAGIRDGWVDTNYHAISADELDAILDNRYDKHGRVRPAPPKTRKEKIRDHFFGLED